MLAAINILMSPRPQNAALLPPVRPDSIDPALSIMSQVSQKFPFSARVWEYEKLLQLAFVPIGRAKRLQWNVNDLKVHFHTANWALNYQDLDLATGQTPSGQCFLEPRTPEQVEGMLQIKKPWLDTFTAAADFRTTLKKQLFVESRFDNATSLWVRISSYLEGSQEIHGPGILDTFTRWWSDL